MQDTYNFKFIELQKIKNNICSYKEALCEIEDKINYLDVLCSFEDRNVLISKKENLQKKIKNLETEKEKLNEELVNDDGMAELIKMKYALLLSSYAVHHDNPVLKTKKEIKPSIQSCIKRLFQPNK